MRNSSRENLEFLHRLHLGVQRTKELDPIPQFMATAKLGGLYLNGSDLAKIGYLYLEDVMWDGQRIVSSEWVKESVPYFHPPAEPDSRMDSSMASSGGLFKLPDVDSAEYVWMGRGYGGQLVVFRKEGLIVTFTAGNVLPTSTGTAPTPPDFLPFVKTKTCTAGRPLMLAPNQVGLIRESGRDIGPPAQGLKVQSANVR
jgi:CubicO group peptidase (beta-lactamase class C family)